jgi:hypothetical protein
MDRACGRWHPRHKRCDGCPQNVGDEIALALLKDTDWWMSRHDIPDFQNDGLPHVESLLRQRSKPKAETRRGLRAEHESAAPEGGDAQ